LRTIKDSLPEEITYDEIRLVVANMRRTRVETAAAEPAVVIDVAN
jgi:hypothetical protein